MRSPKYQTILLFLTLVLGVGLRTVRLVHSEGYLTKNEFDQVLHIKHAFQLLDGDLKWAYLGPEIPLGQPPGQLPSFLYVPLLAFSLKYLGSLIFVYGLLLLLAAAGLLCCYHAVRILRPDNPGLALMTALLLAVLPYPVNFSATHLTPAFLVPLSCLAFWGLARWVIQERQDGFLIAVGALVLMLQVHLIGAFVLVVLPAAAWMFRPRLNRTWLFVGLLIFLVPLLGYLLCDGFSRFENTRTLLRRTAAEPVDIETLKLFSDAFIVGTSDLSYFLPTGGFKIDGVDPSATAQASVELARGFDVYFQFQRYVFGRASIGIAVTAIDFVFLAAALVHVVGRLRLRSSGTNLLRFLREDRPWGLLVLWLLLPSLFLLATGRPHHPRYALVLFPAILLPQAAFWQALRKASSQHLRVLSIVLPCLIGSSVWLDIGHSFFLRQQLLESQMLHPSLNNLEGIRQLLASEAGRPASRFQTDPLGTDNRFYLNSLETLQLYLSIFEEPGSAATATCGVPPGPLPQGVEDYERIGKFRALTVYCKKQEQ